MKVDVVNIKENLKTQRFDASFHLSDGVLAKVHVCKSPYGCRMIGDVAERIFHAGRWKRTYVSNPDYGIELIGSSDMLKSDLNNIKLISRKYTPDIEDKNLKKGWILISCSGTIGNTVFTTKEHAEKLASQDVIRLVPNNILRSGYVYAFLSTKYGYSLLTQGTFGAVIQHIEPENVSVIPIPDFPQEFQQKVDDLIQESAKLREESEILLHAAKRTLKKEAGLRDLTENDYDSFGFHSAKRNISVFSRNINEISAITINAFNYSERIRKMKLLVQCETKPLQNVITNGCLFSTGSFPRNESKNGIELINQSDIFDRIIKGKKISKKKVDLNKTVNYGEILIAGVGTLGESESFCHVIYANEDIQGRLVSGEFIRMIATDEIPSGYLFCWLDTDYGFRLIRNTQTGTKLCRPIQQLLLQIPVPILRAEVMNEIDCMVKNAHTLRHNANVKELKAISMVEQEIEKWNKQ